MKAAPLLWIGLLLAPQAAAADRPTEDVKLEAHLGAGADSVDIKCQQFAAVVTIESQRGIGQLVLRRQPERWPARLTLHLGVYPLEGFTATCGNRQLEASLRFDQKQFRGKVPVQKLADNGADDAVAEQLPIVITPQGDSAVVIDFPVEFLDAKEDELRLHWV
ncbi:MAG: hypothetical protein WD030_04045, partial [Pirellulales bacterium]